MRWDDIYVSAAAASLGREESTADAVADGRYDAEENEASGYLAVRVSHRGPAVDLAVDAANLALKRSGVDPEDVALVMHASIGHQGLDDFAAASYVQSHTVNGRASALEVRQASNGGMASLELGASYLAARPVGPRPSSVLLTTSDRFVPPSWNRWRAASGMLLGDAGTALVLTRGAHGVARLVSSVLIGDATYQQMQIGDEPWTEYPGERGYPLSIQTRVEAFIAERGPDVFPELVQSIGRLENETIHQALADAELEPRDIAWWSFPNMGALTDWYSLEELGVDVSRTTWDWGRRCGHMGAGDQFAGLAHLLESGKARAGDRILFNSTGTGFTFSSAVVEVLEEPDWSSSAG
jgi:3-oxoacyl-[acyl-carrier-protein] synthase-3